MARKKKKKGGKRKKGSTTQSRFMGMSPDELIVAGDGLLDAGNVRDALKAFKRAEKEGALPGTILPRLFPAYLMRCRQLREKKMFKEADAILALALSHRPSGEQLSSDVLDMGIAMLPPGEAVKLYADFLDFHDPLPGMEQKIANRVVLENAVNCLDGFPRKTALGRDRDCIKGALAGMNAGQWEEVMEILRPLPRKSPFSDIKLFARLMAAFGKDDRPAMLKALSMLSDDFPLTSVTALLESHAREGCAKSVEKYPETAACLWGGMVFKDDHARALKKAVDAGEPVKIKKAVVDLASCLDPTAPGDAVEFLAQAAALGIYEKMDGCEPVEALFRLIFSGKKRAREMALRFFAPTAYFFNDMTGEFWRKLKNIIPDKGERCMARALILTGMAREMIHSTESVFEVRYHIGSLFQDLGLDGVSFPDKWNREGMLLAAVECIRHAIVLDPESRESHGLLLDLPLDFPKLRKTMVPMLEEMAQRFPDDPRPCLLLADAYSRKNAVRKAETVLKEAFKRAPHDGDVLERYALSHLTTAFKNMKRGKFDLADRDLDAAEGLEVKSLGVYLAEKRLLCSLLRTGKFSRKFFDDLTRDFTPGEALKTLALFKMDLEDPKVPALEKPRGVAAVFNAHKKALKSLESREIASLLKPVPPLCHGLFSKIHMVSYFMEKRVTLLTRMNSDDFMDIVFDLVEGGVMDLVIRELGRRVAKGQKDDPQGIMMAFLHVSLLHIKGDMEDSKAFSRIIDRAAPPVKERLRAISRRLAPLAPDDLRPAFEQFDFTMMDSPFLEDFSGDFPHGLPGGFPPDLPDDFPSLDEMLGGFIEMVMEDEGFDMRDVNPAALAELKNIMSGDYEKLGRVLENMMEGGDIDLDDDDDDYDDDDLEDFSAGEVSGPGICTQTVIELVHELIDDAEFSLDRTIGDRFDDLEFMKTFERLINVLKKGGIVTPDAFRRMGRNFARDVDGAGDVLKAYDLHGRRCGHRASQNLTYFILGMKTGI